MKYIHFLPLLLLLLFTACACHREATDTRPYSTGYDGIDVSRHNGTIDWKTVRRSNKNIRYVFIKATEGTGHVDRRYLDNAREAHRQGFKIGIYHYFTARSSAHEQFAWFRSQANLTYQDLAPIVDVEEFKGWKSKQQLQDSLMTFVRLVKKHYNKLPIIYTILISIHASTATNSSLPPIGARLPLSMVPTTTSGNLATLDA